MAGALGVIAVAAVAVAAAPSSGATHQVGQEVAQATNDRPIVVSRSRGSYRDPLCRPKRIGRRLEDLSHALRTVDEDALRRFFGWPGFRALSVARRGGKQLVRADSYEAAVRQLRRRGGLRPRFNEVSVIGNGGAFEGTFRTDRGRKPGLFGKAGWSCKRLGIIQMGIVVGARLNVANCPQPRKRAPRRAMIVCSR